MDGGAGVVLGWWVMWVVLGGFRVLGLRGGVLRLRGSASPPSGLVVLVLNLIGIGFLAFCLKKRKKEKRSTSY